MTKMEQTGSEGTSVFDILRARMGMPPIESVPPLPQESNSWSRQIVDALRRHWMSVLRTSLWCVCEVTPSDKQGLRLPVQLRQILIK